MRKGSQTDDFIADTLQKMTLQEREKVYDDLHGVADIIVEEPVFVNQCLERLQEKLNALNKANPNVSTAAFRLAESISPDFVKNQKLRLRFLRAESFDPEKAANRMASFLDFKLQVYGERKLCEEITILDLDYDELKALKKGFLQKLPERDRAGRAVFIFFLCQQEASLTEKSLVSQNMTSDINSCFPHT
jgi:hypothetical protein